MPGISHRIDRRLHCADHLVQILRSDDTDKDYLTHTSYTRLRQP